jgi:flagellar basal-body rod modification protein FlgD
MSVSPIGTLSSALLAKLNGTSTTSSSSSSSTGASTANSNTQISTLDYLNLMMTQLQNQDPTQPMDASAIMGQLAQFGTVEGINNLNTSFSTLSSQLVSNQALQASSLLGQNVLVPGTSAALAAGSGLSGAVTVQASATGVNVQIVNSAGATVQTLSLGNQAAGTVPFSWDGTVAGGGTAPAGTYSIVASGSVNGSGQQLTTLLQGQVGSITLNSSGSSGLVLQVNGIGSVPFSSVQQID